MSKCDCPPAMGGQFLLSGAGLPKNMYKSRKSVLLELLNIEICAILYNVYPKRKGNLTLLHYDAILFDVDGTLIDSAPGILNTLEEVFSSMGVDVARSDLGRYIGPPLRKSFGEHFSDPAKIEEATKRYRVSYAAKGCHDNMDKKDKSEVVVHENGRDSVSEAFRIVRTNMDFMRVKDKKMQVMMFTSFNPGAGKTFVSMNLAMSFALTHKKVVLVDLDIRKGTLSSHVHVSDKGVTNYLSGRIDNVDEIIRQNELCDKLDIIHAGPVPPNPAELLLGDRLETLIAELRKRYDYIILDNVPAGVVADAVIVNRVADLTIYVVRAGRMDRRALPEVEKLYQEGKLRNMSLILNGTVYKHGAYGYRYGYGYGYSYGYGYGYGQHKK